MKYTISCTYITYTEARVTLPDGKTWEDVKEHYIKWDTLHVLLKGSDDWIEIELESAGSADTDWKRPWGVEITTCPEDSDEEPKLIYES